MLPRGHSECNSCDHVGLAKIPWGTKRLTVTVQIDKVSSGAFYLTTISYGRNGG